MASDFKGPVAVCTFSTYPRKNYDPKFFEDANEAIEMLIDDCWPHCERVKELEVFECDRVMRRPNVTAESIIEDMDNSQDFGELPEDEYWSDNISEEDTKALNDFLDTWLPRIEREMWDVSSRPLIVDWDAEIANYLATRPAPETA